MDARLLLRRADTLLKAEQFDDALSEYAKVARFYAQEGDALEALAVWKQVHEIIRERGIAAQHLDREARTSLATLYRGLGLQDDAKAIEEEEATVLS